MGKIKNSKCYRFTPLSDVVLNQRNNFICEPGYNGLGDQEIVARSLPHSPEYPYSLWRPP
jgi:hypothetical protein